VRVEDAAVDVKVVELDEGCADDVVLETPEE